MFYWEGGYRYYGRGTTDRPGNKKTQYIGYFDCVFGRYLLKWL